MQVFISLPWKILGLLIAGLLLGSVLLTYTWLDKLDEDFAKQQEFLLNKDAQQYKLLTDMLLNRMETRLESLVRFRSLDGQSKEQVAQLVEEEIEHLQMNWQVGDLWLFKQDGELLYGTTSKTPAHILRDKQKVADQQMSVANIRCDRICELYVSVPILLGQQSWAILSSSSSLLETLAYLNQATGADLALFKDTANHQRGSLFSDLRLQEPLAISKKHKLQYVLSQMPENLYLKDMLENGARLELEDSMLLLNLLPLQQEQQSAYLLLMHDITEFSRAHKAYQQRVLWIAVSVFLLLLGLFFWLTRRFRRRLVSLAGSLPLLAQKRYQDFHKRQSQATTLFRDELEILQDSATSLGEELERLDGQVEAYTRELENIAMFDKLTGLPNRNKLSFYLGDILPTLVDKHGILSVLFLDFDNFRKINDSHGHSLGDDFLVTVTKELYLCIEKEDFICRFGGDEFVLVLAPRKDERQILKVAEAIQRRFCQPVQVQNLSFHVSVSIGISVTMEPTAEPEELIRQADMAMYHAKDQGGNRPCLYNEQMYRALTRRTQLEEEVREALNYDELSFALQPQIEILTGRLVGFEALLRWIHPQKGFVPPDEFIPLLENTESMLRIGYWGLRKAFEILQRLRAMGLMGCKIAVNLSAEQMLDSRLGPYLQELLAEFGPYAQWVELELTERTLVMDIDHCLGIMHQLREMGFSFSIDDFGTGYSSLSYLKKMPVEVIKIDRSFVAGMLENHADYQIVSSTIAMVHNLGMRVVAEGVENKDQLRCLNELDCEIGQGYYISRPIMESDLFSILSSKVKDGIWQGLGHAAQIPNL
ncbi:hypothetical protein GCM10009092_04740 [Bowmanella denitrificans]|uniref:Diguanylate cyclase (GGDEF) domain-containing protein n=1 Tax=Bowmanella denitrificans TaxID=366582 RepID=A0ABN0WP44_9ALTE